MFLGRAAVAACPAAAASSEFVGNSGGGGEGQCLPQIRDLEEFVHVLPLLTTPGHQYIVFGSLFGLNVNELEFAMHYYYRKNKIGMKL